MHLDDRQYSHTTSDSCLLRVTVNMDPIFIPNYFVLEVLYTVSSGILSDSTQNLSLPVHVGLDKFHCTMMLKIFYTRSVKFHVSISFYYHFETYLWIVFCMKIVCLIQQIGKYWACDDTFISLSSLSLDQWNGNDTYRRRAAETQCQSQHARQTLCKWRLACINVRAHEAIRSIYK